jgi:hypothetical protein
MKKQESDALPKGTVTSLFIYVSPDRVDAKYHLATTAWRLLVIKIATFALSALFATATAAGTAPYSAYMTAKGRTQGLIMGAGRSKSGKIPVIRFTMSDSKPLNARANPTEIEVEFDGMDILGFKRAYNSNESLSTVEIDVASPAVGLGAGKLTVNEKILLTNATVKTLIESYADGNMPTATITFNYQTLQVTEDGHTTMSADDWTR